MRSPKRVAGVTLHVIAVIMHLALSARPMDPITPLTPRAAKAAARLSCFYWTRSAGEEAGLFDE